MVGSVTFHSLTNQIIELIMWSGVYVIMQQSIQQYNKSDLCHTHQFVKRL